MRVVFIGVVDTGWHCLKALLEIKADIAGVFTANKQEIARKSGMHPDYFGDFDGLCKQWGVPVQRIEDMSVPLDIARIKELEPDIIFCIGWPQIIGQEILAIPPEGCIGIHPTLLPARRGGAPINWGLIDGLKRSGVTLFYFDKGIDSGDIIAQQEFDIDLNDTARTVLDKVTDISISLVRESYPLLEKGEAPRMPQDGTKATYTRRRRPEDGVIDWRRTSLAIHNWIRALTLPFPGAFTSFQGKKVVVWDSELLTGYRASPAAQPGEHLDFIPGRGLVVATGDNCILVKTIEIDDEKMDGSDLMIRFKIHRGSKLGDL